MMMPMMMDPWGKGDWGWMMGKGWGKGPSPSGPDLPRERISEAPVTGEVLEWKGTFGWVKPHGEISHESASKKDGKVYIHKQDLQGGISELAAGNIVQFIPYSDSSGVGGEQVFLR
eukprot:gnl/TRDRNA2_/TRDRNA2_40297_c1_seq1.p1 gnl/TRDRNA2_/TRDRNA2_40297_c1~~gnl/TRDRNA2_/TRDRNA2_40297_c1_seq1.p1  ORF type:complete len:116 (+),score=21.14 gnl/TRDRNA2_/TRDRNA2_40297_c1_seq1:2-349(+)